MNRLDPRHLLLAGPAYALLLVVAAAAFPAPPGGDVAAGTDPAWLAQHTGAVIAQTYVRGLAAVAFALVGVGLWHLGSRAAAAGSVITGTLMLVSQALALGSAQLVAATGGDPRALAYAQEALLDLSSLPAVVLFAATARLALRDGVGPRWFGWVSLLGVPLGVGDALSYDGGPLEVLGLPGLAYFLLWSLLVGFLLHRASRVSASSAVSAGEAAHLHVS